MVFDLFSKRRARERGEAPDVFKYDVMPEKLRVQIIYIVQDAFGHPDDYRNNRPSQYYSMIAKVLKEEYGLFRLVEHSSSDSDDVIEFFMHERDVERVLDVVELFCRTITNVIGQEVNYDRMVSGVKLTPAEAIANLNIRFRELGIGYEFISGEIIRVDNQLLHAEAVIPALTLLRQKGFSGPNEEFLEAHSHFRKGELEPAVVAAAKAFESTLKVICDARGWKYEANATAKNLINVVLTKGLVPNYLESQLASLRGLLESTVTVRNKDAGHGAGSVPRNLPEWAARYAMNMTAATILFLVEAHVAKK